MSSKDKIKDDISYRPLAIRLNNFRFRHGPEDDYDINDDGLFIGREKIVKKLVMLLEGAKDRRGSFLVAGYRGAGKTSVVNRAIAKCSYPKCRIKFIRRIKDIFCALMVELSPFPVKQKKPVVVRLNLGNRERLGQQDIFYSIANILRDEISLQIPLWLRKAGYVLLVLFGSCFLLYLLVFIEGFFNISDYFFLQKSNELGLLEFDLDGVQLSY